MSRGGLAPLILSSTFYNSAQHSVSYGIYYNCVLYICMRYMAGTSVAMPIINANKNNKHKISRDQKDQGCQ